MIHLKNAISTVQNEYNAYVVTVVTDASGKCRKACRLLSIEYPDIVFLDCYAHQVLFQLYLHFRRLIALHRSISWSETISSQRLRFWCSLMRQQNLSLGYTARLSSSRSYEKSKQFCPALRLSRLSSAQSSHGGPCTIKLFGGSGNFTPSSPLLLMMKSD